MEETTEPTNKNPKPNVSLIMEHSICLDSEKINSIRESLEGRFNQIKIIDDSVTPKIIQWLNDEEYQK